MKNAADFRSIARDTLTGKWKNAVLVGLVASILGAVDGAGLIGRKQVLKIYLLIFQVGKTLSKQNC